MDTYDDGQLPNFDLMKIEISLSKRNSWHDLLPQLPPTIAKTLGIGVSTIRSTPTQLQVGGGPTKATEYQFSVRSRGSIVPFVFYVYALGDHLWLTDNLTFRFSAQSLHGIASYMSSKVKHALSL